MSNKQPNKHSKRIQDIYCATMYPKFNENYNLYKKFILLSSECTTRQATQEELDKYKYLIKS